MLGAEGATDDVVVGRPDPVAAGAAAGARGGSGLWMNADLVRAIKTESAEALAYWFGIAPTTAWRWRTWLDVAGWTKTTGSRRLHEEVSERAAAAVRAKAKAPAPQPERITTPGIHDFLTPAGCAAVIARSEAAGYGDAPIATGRGFVPQDWWTGNRYLFGRGGSRK
jgi:hypothetical protein